NSLTNLQVSTSSLSLVLAEKVQRSKALVECEGDSIDLSGDMGSVGRVIVQDNPAGNSDVYFDLKGTIYKTSIVPSRTFCVVCHQFFLEFQINVLFALHFSFI
ncbi:DNA-binding protein BIN4, partial [Linum perenne]